MIPIIYDSDENLFASNGLGRITDCLSCVVTEERNGIYECDFEYPVSGVNYDLIKIGNIIGVTHNDSDDIQPFDIVSCNKPINGIVSFHAVHISYRQNYLTTYGTNINNIDDAFLMLESAVPTNPFYYEATFTRNGFLACADGTPRTVREILGGVEGSILDTYGGEYEFDKWNVILHGERGETRDFTIRYGVNMTDYNDEIDISDAFNCCIPYWSGSEGIVKSSIAQSDDYDVNGRNTCVPLDLSDKFENKPTVASLQSAAENYMNSNRTYLPVQTITVSFYKLNEMDASNGISDLFKCQLCDTVNVAFPDYNVSERFKIVKTIWNVLLDRYDEMELGTLSTTLSEALGISNNLDRTNLIPVPDDYIISKGKDGSWYYEKWSSGKVEAWGSATTGTLTMSGSSRVYVAQNVSITNAIPDGIFDYAPTFCEVFSHYSSALCYAVSGYATSKRNISLQLVKTSNNTAAVTVQLHCIYYPASYN